MKLWQEATLEGMKEQADDLERAAENRLVTLIARVLRQDPRSVKSKLRKDHSEEISTFVGTMVIVPSWAVATITVPLWAMVVLLLIAALVGAGALFFLLTLLALKSKIKKGERVT